MCLVLNNSEQEQKEVVCVVLNNSEQEKEDSCSLLFSTIHVIVRGERYTNTHILSPSPSPSLSLEEDRWRRVKWWEIQGGEILSVSSIGVREEVGVDGVVGAKTVWGGD